MNTPRSHCVAVIDVGKTNVKVIVVNAAGETLAQRTVLNEVERTGPYPHFDVQAIFEWVVTGLTTFAKEYPIDTIIPVTHGATGVLWDGEGLALPVLDYEFEGLTEIDSEYLLAASDFRNTCSPKLPNGLNFGKQLFWLKRRFPEKFARATQILMYPQYFALQLTGQLHSEVTSLGCHTDLWEPEQKCFSKFCVNEGFASKFPALRSAYASAGALLPQMVRRTGLDPNVRVLTGIHDSNASYFAYAAPRQAQAQFAVVSTGTWVVCMAKGVGLAGLREELDMLANVDAFGDPVASARFMGGREYEVLAGSDGLLAQPTLLDLEHVLETALPLPCFSSQGGPFRESKGQIIGQAPQTPTGRAALAALYAALMTDHCLRSLRVAGDVIVDGPFAKNPLFASVLAGLRPTQSVFFADAAAAGTARGAAQLAAWPTSLSIRLTPVEGQFTEKLQAYRERWYAALPVRR